MCRVSQNFLFLLVVWICDEKGKKCMLRSGCCRGISPKSIVGSAFCPLLTWLQSQRAAWKESLSLQQEWIGHRAPVGSLPDHDYLLCLQQPLSPHSPDSDKTCTGTGVNVWLLLFLMGGFDTSKPFYILWERSGIKQPLSVIDPMVSQTWVEKMIEICAKPSPSWAANGSHPNDICTLPSCHSPVCTVPNKAQPNSKQLEGRLLCAALKPLLWLYSAAAPQDRWSPLLDMSHKTRSSTAAKAPLHFNKFKYRPHSQSNKFCVIQ